MKPNLDKSSVCSLLRALQVLKGQSSALVYLFGRNDMVQATAMAEKALMSWFVLMSSVPATLPTLWCTGAPSMPNGVARCNVVFVCLYLMIGAKVPCSGPLRVTCVNLRD